MRLSSSTPYVSCALIAVQRAVLRDACGNTGLSYDDGKFTEKNIENNIGKLWDKYRKN